MITFDIYNPTELCNLMYNYGSDKGGPNLLTSWHNYTPIYYSLLNRIKLQNLNIFELGLGTNNPNVPSNMGINGKPGASLYAWSEFLPNSNIYGADIDTNILFNTNRIKTYYCDQTNPMVIDSMWSNTELIDKEFDLILEDGLHDFNANVTFFERSIHKLKIGGYYIIEDIWNHQLELFDNKIKEWESNYTNLIFQLLVLPSTVNYNDNNLLICKRRF